MPQKSVRNAAAIQSSEQGQSLFENISSVKKVILSIIYQREREITFSFVFSRCKQHIFLVFQRQTSCLSLKIFNTLVCLFHCPLLSLILFLRFFLSLCRNPMCHTVTVKWLASYRTRWAGTAAPPCLSVALPLATTIQRPNPPWCLANGNVLPC